MVHAHCPSADMCFEPQSTAHNLSFDGAKRHWRLVTIWTRTTGTESCIGMIRRWQSACLEARRNCCYSPTTPELRRRELTAGLWAQPCVDLQMTLATESLCAFSNMRAQ